MQGFGQYAWSLLLVIYKQKNNTAYVDNLTFQLYNNDTGIMECK